MTVMTAPSFARPFTVDDLAALPDDGRIYELVDGSLLVRRAEPFTVAEVEALPDDGRRHELVDGVLLVTPGPSVPHQDVVFALHRLLRDAAPSDLKVTGGVDNRTGDDTLLIPDLLVGRRADFVERGLPARPVLVVEVRSPSTARVDGVLKRAVYELRGVPSYWLVDPKRPSITVLELHDGRYEHMAVVAGNRELIVQRPFPVRIVPDELVADLSGREEGDGELGE